MMKYIIDVPDDLYVMNKELCVPWFFGENPTKHWLHTGISVKPYEEPDREAIEQEIRKQIEDEVWGLARKIILAPVHGGLDADEMIDCFGSRYYNKTMLGTYAEAKAKYDKWKKNKDKIKVGDELRNIYNPEVRICVTYITDDDMICGFAVTDTDFCHIGGDYQNRELKYWEKTDRHFTEISDFLEKMKEES